jgi:putative FmdB family regulatory protein
MKKGHVFEVFQKISDKPLKKCQVCESPVEKLVSSSSFQLKGTGWYETDFKNSGKRSAPKAEKQSKGET